MVIVKFLQEALAEFKKIQWPTKKQTMRLTAYVVGVSVIVALYVGGLDYILKEAISSILTR